jgi:hypothetical protein
MQQSQFSSSPPPQRKSNNGPLFAVSGIAAIVIGILSYMLYSEKQISGAKDDAIQSQANQLANTKIKVDSIARQLDAKIAEIQQLGGEVKELQEAKAQLENDRASLSTADARTARTYESKLANYVSLLARKDQDLIKLRKENEHLSNENQNLNNQNSSLKSEKDVLVKTNDEIAAQNKELNTRISAAAAIKANSVEVWAVSSNGKEDNSGKFKASKVSKIRVVFQLAANELAKQDDKDIYMKVFEPSGALVSDATASGSFNFNGKEDFYTVKKTISYTSDDQWESIYYAKSGEYKPGRYLVELYAEGRKLGEGLFAIK